MRAGARTVETSLWLDCGAPRKRCRRQTDMAPGAPSSANGGVLTRLLLVNQHYYPDVASTGQHLTDLAEYLAQEGYLVEVLTGRVRYVAGRMEAPARGSAMASPFGVCARRHSVADVTSAG